MALNFHPEPGTILMCDFSSGFAPPEIVKRRPVIVVSPKLKRHSGLCTVVAISTAEPLPAERWHYKIPSSCMPALSQFREKDSWLKGDMIYRVGLNRLDLIKLGRGAGGKRIYFKKRLQGEQMTHVYACILNALNLTHITQHI